MKKFSLLLGTVGGALAGYILSNEKLRTDLKNAKKPEDAAKLLGKHLQTDGSKVAKEVQAFVKSDDVQKNVTKMKKLAMTRFNDAKKGLQDLMKRGTKEAGKMVKKGTKAVKDRI